ncbi:MAG: type III pantothenate kinase [Bacteroidales bacterium]|nr:type III pantothenate kinase [Bacteroidales bacterium]MDD4670713.1 type III pantothenate kinase [Bacteroidales bacterium]
MNLLIDIGNTACKIAFSTGNTIGKIIRYGGDDISSFIVRTIKKECNRQILEVAVLSNVRKDDRELEEVLRTKCCRRLVVLDLDMVRSLLSEEGDVSDFEVLENMPDGMGADRMAAILASNNLFPDKDLMVFDFGTATTVEYINGRRDAGLFDTPQKAKYLGGTISLGLNTRYKALSYYTQRIPLLNPNDFLEKHNVLEISTIGTDLDTSLAAGNILGIMFEIQGYMASHPDRTVIFTGGDAIYFADLLKREGKNTIFVVYNLVLMGLSQIARHYVETKNV